MFIKLGHVGPPHPPGALSRPPGGREEPPAGRHARAVQLGGQLPHGGVEARAPEAAGGWNPHQDLKGKLRVLTCQ